MKTLFKTLSLLCLVLLVIACQNDDPKPVDPSPGVGDVQFAFSSVTKINSNSKSAAFEEFPSGAYLSVILLSGSDSVNQNLSLIKLGDGYISEPMTLLEAEFEITDFMIMNEDGEAIYATPKEDSPLALYVDHPLPVNFIVTQGELINLNMEVVDVIGHSPEDFGYVSFQIEIVPVPQFSLSVFIPENGELVLTDAQGYILYEGDTIVNNNLQSGINTIDFMGSPEGNYSLVVIKPGYGRYTKDFTLQDLKDQQGNSPIKVLLVPAFTFVTPLSGAFTFVINGSEGMTLHVDWGDGSNTETVIDGPEILLFEHLYEMAGPKFVTITGDITLIEDVSFAYDDAGTSRIHLNHLINLTHFGMVLTKSPSEIDFSDNLKLKELIFHQTSIRKVDISKNLELEILEVSYTLISSAKLDKIIADLLNNSASATMPDYTRYFTYGPNLPSATGLANLAILENEYGWNVQYYDVICCSD